MKFKKFLQVGALSLAVAFSFSMFMNIKRNEDTEKYLRDNLHFIMQAQEERLGITYKNIPRLVHKIPIQIRDPFAVIGLEGRYMDETDTIYVVPKFLGKKIRYKAILDHELGHLYEDELRDSLGLTLDWATAYGGTMPRKKGYKLISEGVAEYFSRTMNNGKDDFNDAQFPSDHFDESNGFLIYAGGFHLVKPIIDKYGKKGIDYLLLNPPEDWELTWLPKYRERIIDELEKPY